MKSSVYQLLSPDHKATGLSLAVNVLIISMVLLSVLAMALETEPSIMAGRADEFRFFERFALTFFCVEFALRLWVSTEDSRFKNRLAFIRSGEAFIDMLAILPLLVALVSSIDLRLLIIVRLLRLLKLVRYFGPLQLMGKVIRAEAQAFVSALFFLLIIVFCTATGIYLLEHQVQPEHLGSIPKAMWWSVVTLTTLGYGDVVPLTLGGRIFAGAMTIMAVGIVALPAGMLASRFSHELHQRKQLYSNAVQTRLSVDKTIDNKEQLFLDSLRQDLCLSEEDARILVAAIKQRSVKAGDRFAPNFCRSCGASID